MFPSISLLFVSYTSSERAQSVTGTFCLWILILYFLFYINISKQNNNVSILILCFPQVNLCVIYCLSLVWSHTPCLFPVYDTYLTRGRFCHHLRPLKSKWDVPTKEIRMVSKHLFQLRYIPLTFLFHRFTHFTVINKARTLVCLIPFRKE